MSFYSMVVNHSVKPSNKIRRICEPLYRHFGINHFWYSKTTSDGGFVSIGSNPGLHAYYYSSKLYLHSPFFHDPKFIEPGFYFYRNFNDPYFQETIDQGAREFNVELCATVTRKQDQGLIRFGYAAAPENVKHVSHLLINNIELLNNFNDHFLKEAAEIIAKADNDLMDLPSEIGKSYMRKPVFFEETMNSMTKCAFLESLGGNKASEIGKLSPREKQCLKYLYQGYNIPQIGLYLDLSPRTVESYLGHIKNKLNCDSRLELIEAARILSACGFFNF